jgi:DNA modification methylase
MVMTSPPYLRLRQYSGNPSDAFGQEKTVAEYVAHSVEALREVRRVLKDDGVVFWNISDTYDRATKSLCLVPERVAVAARDDGWIVRDIIVWHKPSPVPESVRDRCTRSYEPILMLAKQKHYYFDCDAIAEPSVCFQRSLQGGSMRAPKKEGGAQRLSHAPVKKAGCKYGKLKLAEGQAGKQIEMKPTRNRRNVWTIATEPHKDSHIAQFPSELPRLCIKAGSRPGDLVLDPFAGSGTTGIVARELGRNAVLLDISAEYARKMREKLEGKKHNKAGAARVGIDSGDLLRHPGSPPRCADRGLGIVPVPQVLPTPAGDYMGSSL